MRDTTIVTRLDTALTADPARVLARLFVPGHELVGATESRASGVLARICALPEEQVRATLQDVLARFAGRHRDLHSALVAHYEEIAHRAPAGAASTEERRLLIGAWFTHEYSIEAAALFNPSIVAHPDQSGMVAGQVRFVMSLRAVGEGHVSSVEFRTGTFGPGDRLELDDPGPHVESGRCGEAVLDKALFAALLTENGADEESAAFVLDELPDMFGAKELERALRALSEQRVTLPGGPRTAERAWHIARSNYAVEFSPRSAIAERVLWPHGPSEARGMEDARFVRVVADDGTATYRATYTAFDGDGIAPQVLETPDFRRFHVSQLAGPAARNKGMALFPRTVGGQHVALSRWDRESNTITTSPDGVTWEEPRTLHVPARTWELTQTGNCGSPIETEAGWLVLTHGVGPVREYSIGALLLDLEEPTRVLGALREPLLRPGEDERDGYVPNVVYSCGSLLHGDRLLLPYGASDASVRFAVVDVPQLLDRLAADGPPSTTSER